MSSILYKWLLLGSAWVLATSLINHPIYVSVTEIEHNSKDKTLEISCKIFTDDFEKTLRAAYNAHVDLIKASEKSVMEKLVSDYVIRHLMISVNGKKQTLQYKGYELIDEAIYSYFQVDNIVEVKKITVTDNILYDYQSQQMGLLHITANGNRQSTKLVNPEDKAEFSF
jgi:hypothetical protein